MGKLWLVGHRTFHDHCNLDSGELPPPTTDPFNRIWKIIPDREDDELEGGSE